MDVIRLGDTPSSEQLGVAVLFLCFMFWVNAWKYSIAPLRTYITAAMLVILTVDVVTGRYLAYDTLAVAEDLAWIAASLALAWPLKKHEVQIFDTADELSAALKK